MNKRLTLFSLFFLIQGMLLAQVPQVPGTMEFAGMKLQITKAARKKIQEDVNRLHKSPKYFQAMVAKADLFFPVIEQVFKEEGFPDDIKYLCIQESAINPTAVSSSDAVGYWQFKKATAQEVGLRVDGGPRSSSIDERKNIVSASRGAAKYMTKNNKMLGNWVYALTSYNTGLGGVQKYVKDKYRGAKKMEIDSHTHWYFLKFLAHKIAYEGYVGKSSLNQHLEIQNAPVGKNLKQICRQLGIAEADMKQYNEWLGTKKVPYDKPYPLVIPRSGVGATFPVFADNNDDPVDNGQSETSTTSGEDLEVHNTQVALGRNVTLNGIPAIRAYKGENSARLALKGGITRRRFLRYNDLKSFEPLKAGQAYYLKSKNRKAEQEFYTVKKGETLWEVSQKFGVKEKFIRKRNHLRRHEVIREGRVLWLNNTRPKEEPVKYEEQKVKEALVKEKLETKTKEPKVEEKKVEVVVEEKEVVQEVEEKEEEVAIEVKNEVEEPAEVSVVKHTVKAGETLYAISRKYGVAPADLTKWNNLNGSGLNVGDELVVYVPREMPEEPVKEKVEVVGEEWHEVQAGETMYQIARKYEVSVDDIRQWNNKSDNNLSVGERLRVRK